VLVIGAPMYNFGIPSQLKSWIDHILVAGKTFRYTDTGAEGLAGAKKVIIASARGGIYAPGGPLAAIDFQEPHLKTLFRFLGIEQLTVIRAEGVAIGPEQRAAAIEEALAAAPNLAEAALAA
jgi:FMN-dependent NADH-azoreductase